MSGSLTVPAGVQYAGPMSNNAGQPAGSDSSGLPLSDVKVLELGTLIAGPFAGRVFADFGAEVIKVEHPERGDPLRTWGMGWNGSTSLWHLIQSRGKRSVAARFAALAGVSRPFTSAAARSTVRSSTASCRSDSVTVAPCGNSRRCEILRRPRTS